MLRIGRQPSPTERALQFALEDDEMLENLAFNLMEAELFLSSMAAERRWLTITELERSLWKDRVVEDLRDAIRLDAFDSLQPLEPKPGKRRLLQSHLKIVALGFE
jgi:hypothetical protein